MSGNSGGINFNILSGNVRVDSVMQGDNNIMHQHSSGEQIQNLLESTLRDIDQTGRERNASANEINELKNAIQILIKQRSEKTYISETLKELYNKFSWAIDPLQKLYKVLVSL